MRTVLIAASHAITLAVLASSALGAAPLQAGVAVADITPPIGYRLSGYFVERKSTAVHDPLHAKAIVFAQGDVRCAIVFCDLIAITYDVADRSRKLAAESTDIPAANIAVAATHTHTGPLYAGILRRHLHDAAVAREGRDPCESIDYPAFLVKRIAEVIAGARAALRPVDLAAGTAPQTPQVSFNRRFHMKDGRVQFNPGESNPNIVRPAGPIDPDVGILLVRDAERKAIATLTVFALHLDTTGGTEYSADYPYYLEESLRKSLGGELVSLFGTGTCGDVNHIDVHGRARRRAPELGAALARTVLDAIPKLQPVDRPALAVRSRVLTAPLQRYSDAQIAQAAKDLPLVGARKIPFLQEVEACKIMDLRLRGGTTLPLDVRAIRLGRDLAIVTLPGEVFVDLGLAIKRASPFKHTFVIELTNGDPAYIPTKKAFAEGSYEIVNSRLQPGAGEQMAQTATALLAELAAQ